MAVSKSDVLSSLRRVKGPDLESNIVDLGLVSEIAVKDERVYFSITVPAQRADELEALRQAAAKVVSDIEGVAGVTAVLTADAASGATPAKSPMQAEPSSSNVHEHPRVQEARARMSGSGPGARKAAGARSIAIPGVRHVIAVASGKGGVGKSTTAANLALGFQALGLKAGVLDADVYGPSQPRLLGISGKPETAHGKTLHPMEGYGLKVMSMGFMVDEDTAVIWRGPMVVQALTHMLREVVWGDLDVLVVDMPPGTGEVQLTLAQQVPMSGAIIVSTPQDLALIDARKGLSMFEKVDVPVLGVIENMSYFLCPKCGERTDVFGHGGAREEAEKLGVPFLGGIPLDMEIRATSDKGKPITATNPQSPHAAVFRELAAKTMAELEKASGQSGRVPELLIGDDGRLLKVNFDDGRNYVLTAEMLRVLSPSAEVQGHSAAERVTVAKKKDVKIVDLSPIGHYAAKITFDDGHNTGLFTWTYLDELGREKEKRWDEYLAELETKGLTRD